jgi:hypothetical protein
MISFVKILRQLISEALSFKQLLSTSDPKRMDRATHVNPRSLRVAAKDGNESWSFSYKSQREWSTTKMRHRGEIRFLKENVELIDNAEDLECIVDCSCPDYKYRWAYHNAAQGSGVVGSNSLSKNNGQPPKTADTDLGPGLCKHLISLGEYLKTNIDPPAGKAPVAPSDKNVEEPTTTIAPDNVGFAPQPPENKKTKFIPKSPKRSMPSNPSNYSDSRSGDLMESKESIASKIQKFVESNPEFDVTYDDE